MLSLLARLWIKDAGNTESPAVRQAYGMLCGGLGIVLNLLLFGGKLFAGLLSGSVAILADAFNNLSDAGSSLVTLIGFRLAGQKPDIQHPFGHGRLEYISGLIVSMAILIMGFELAKSSAEKIFSPSDVTFSLLTAVILAVSVLVKLYMFLYNRSVGRKIESAAMHAAASDSLSDALATTVVLLSMLVSHFFRLRIDGWCGLLVSVFICISGIKSVKETISPLLGQPADPDYVKKIRDIVMAHPGILGIHDLIVHDYGPGRAMVSLHAEVSDRADLLETHDMIDNAEQELRDKLGCDAVIHMDPVATDDALTLETRKKISELVKIIDASVTIHDFRMVVGPTHTNLIFDIVIPFGFRLSDKQVLEDVSRIVTTLDENYRAVVRIDKSYVA